LGQTLTIQSINSHDYTIKEVKLKIQNERGIPKERQQLIFNGKILEHNKTLADEKKCIIF
jgi:hypothetical protein